jgi:membrane dipeptidase
MEVCLDASQSGETNPQSFTRRCLLKGGLGLATVAMAAPRISLGYFQVFEGDTQRYSARTIDLIQSSVIIDFISSIEFTVGWGNAWWMEHPKTFAETTVQKMRDSNITVFHPTVAFGGPDAHAKMMHFVAGANGFIAYHDQLFSRIDSSHDFNRTKEAGKMGIMIGTQNAEHFRTVDDVDRFFDLGQRVAQLTYNNRNLVGDGGTERTDSGLSDYGVEIVERMNSVGMAVDLSHCSDQTTLDALEVSLSPVLFTHTNCRALVPGHPRCKSDEMIRKLAESGGVMGITNVRNFVRDREPTTIEHVLDHYDHVTRLVGAEHVAVGTDSDLNGYDALTPDEYRELRAGFKPSYAFREKLDIEGLAHPRKIFDLTEGLIRRGYSDTDIRGILGGNAIRALSSIWDPN